MKKKRYNDYGRWLKKQFPFHVQKIMVDAGFTCPNRDGSKGTGGCIYCDNRSFSPSYCDAAQTITQQVNKGKAFFGRKYPDMRYIVYFQSYSNTYADLDTLRRKYEEALSVEDVVGIMIGTRPDCVDHVLLDYLGDLSRQVFVVVEYGIESINDHTLRAINRQHDFACTQRAIKETASRGIHTGGHVILGLPGEDKDELLRQASVVSSLPLQILKIHHLQVLKGTRLAQMHASSPLPLFRVEEYVPLLAEYISRLRDDILLERFVTLSPKEMVVAPHWGLKSQVFTKMLEDYMEKEDLWQGKEFRQYYFEEFRSSGVEEFRQ